MAEYYQPLAVSRGTVRGMTRKVFARYGTNLELFLLVLLLLLFLSFIVLPTLCIISPNAAEDLCGLTDANSKTVLLSLAGLGLLPTCFALYLSLLRNESIRFHGRGLGVGFSMKDETRRDNEGVLFVRPSSVGLKDGVRGVVWLKRMLFVRFFFAKMTEHLLQFLLPIVFIDAFPQTLVPGAAAGLAAYTGCLLLLPTVNSFLRRSNRLSATVHRVLDHMAFAVLALVCLHLLFMQRMGDIHLPALFSSSRAHSHIVLGVSLKRKKRGGHTPAPSLPTVVEEGDAGWETALLTTAIVSLVAVEILNRSSTLNDWANVISKSYLPSDSDESDDDYAFISGQYLEDTDWTQNTRRSRSIHGGKLLHRTLQCCVCVKCVEAFSRINLACAILAVCSVVAVLQFGDDGKNRAVLGLLELGIIWTVLSMLVQVIALRELYRACPALAERNSVVSSTSAPLYEQFGATRASSRGRLLRGRLVARVHRLFRSWATFFSNPFVLVNLSSCVLHASLLVNGPQVLSYLRWAQVPPISIGIVWIAAAVCAFVGEGIAVTTHRCTGSLTKTGFLLLCLFASSIVLAGMAFNGMFIDSLGLSEALLAVCAIAFSRGFYEAYSLTQMQLVQEHIEDDLLYYVLSTQSSVMFMCLITSQAVTIAIPNPADFSQLVSFSVASVLIATLSYVGWYTCYDRGPYQVVDEIGRLKLDVRG